MIQGLLETAGGVGVFLLGMVVMTQGLRALAGGAQARALARFTRSPASGAATGAVSTAVLQSSSATTVAAVGFVGAGLLTFPQALGVVFGANLGTTVTGWLVALLGFKLDLGAVASPILLGGVLLHLFGRGRLASAGLAAAGFALVFLGIETLKAGLSGLEGFATPASFPDDTPGGRVRLVLIGVAVTLVTQSSSAGVATAIAAVHAGAIRFPQAAALVIGMDIGTTFSAWMATLGASSQAKRTGYAHVIYNVLTGLGAFLLLTPYARGLAALAPEFLADEPELCLVGFHTLFNGLGVALVLPFARPFARLIERLVPERGAPLTAGLDERLLVEDPAYGLEAARGALEASAPLTFGELAGLLREGAPRARVAERLAPVATALDRTRGYLARLTTPPQRAELFARHQALVHAADHLHRLVERSGRRTPAPDVRADPEIARATDSLAALLGSFAVPPGAAEEEAARVVWDGLEENHERLRHDVIRRAAAGELGAPAAVGRLDEARRLRRLAYHAWRIAHHLRRASPGGGAQELVGDPPLRSAPIAEELGAGQEEEPPALAGARGLAGSPALAQNLEHGLAPALEVGEPVLGRPRVMGTRDRPAPLGGEGDLEVVEQVVAGHHPAAEEVPRHPVGGTARLVGIGVGTVGEEVQEEPAVGPQPASDAGEQLLPVAHVLEHLDRDHPVEAPPRVELAHVGRDDLEVVQPQAAGPVQDEDALRLGVRHRQHAAAGKALGGPQGQGAPAAAQLEHVLPIRQAGPLGGQGQHGVLGLGQGLVAALVERAAVLEARTQHQLEEARGQPVVLLVRPFRQGRRGRRGRRGRQAHAGDPPVQGALPILPVAGVFLPQPAPQQAPDSVAHQGQGHVAALYEAKSGLHDVVEAIAVLFAPLGAPDAVPEAPFRILLRP